MVTRSAEATIKGYYYQFDTSILQLLELKNDDDSIVVEGIEDIDINTATDDTTIQCKYLSKPKFTNSAVREPIILMLDHFVNPATTNTYKYILYAHFKDENSGDEPRIELSKLKEILTYKKNKIEIVHHESKKISDKKLSDFLTQFKLIFGRDFDLQQKEVIESLKKQFKCPDFEANTLYYNNALRIIFDKAIQADERHRKIRKADFIREIDCRKILFSNWYIKLLSKEKYLKLAAKNLKSINANVPSNQKIILIGKSFINANNPELPLTAFIQNLVEKYYKFNSALRDAKPLTIALDGDVNEIKEIKKNLIRNEILFNDGREEIEFSSAIFNQEPIINLNKAGNKIVKSSYALKIISKKTLFDSISSISHPRVFFIFSEEEVPNEFPETQFFDFKYCDDLKDVYKLLAP